MRKSQKKPLIIKTEKWYSIDEKLVIYGYDLNSQYPVKYYGQFLMG